MADNEDKKKKPENQASDDALEKRRKALKNILAGGGAVVGAATQDKWARPVVESVVLPAHAQASGTTLRSSNGPIAMVSDNDTMMAENESLLDVLVPKANALPACQFSGQCVEVIATNAGGIVKLSGGASDSFTFENGVGTCTLNGEAAQINLIDPNNVATGGVLLFKSGTCSGTSHQLTVSGSCVPTAMTTPPPVVTTTTTTTPAPFTTPI